MTNREASHCTRRAAATGSDGRTGFAKWPGWLVLDRGNFGFAHKTQFAANAILDGPAHVGFPAGTAWRSHDPGKPLAAANHAPLFSMIRFSTARSIRSPSREMPSMP